ncbi:bifunctional phosphopantothenoylcysteine decarboxylase/phosphopantothenate--cysteine ligase CoaBC [Dermatobacter hominis]|uniref:bifunctional phosphopantothenoylcysteine decarboxylase/phosphopantothenate--cysteine ligase CoaBC n=1 Tax=Dermatobacter hominis TaxID=2884263 RepID=UPI001D127093|nr:bifunctional phosphopantothenoylcysteine decarboxylase/phosphopantothenate--cysteine ligase CoaBC [Dermatobacter hominis]UDY36201.1 bifunctional phosphopantothenoylcysteine decarboxylase/phosphopantothenate--cysteine ligase CoaBC [Dermatobacter hominis]
MSSVAGRRVVLGVCGGIAAYKAVEVCRRLVDAGAHVVPVMTAGASHFIGETTLSALASEPVRRTLWDGADPIPHTRLGQTADLVVVAPATARLLSAYAHGYSHDLLTNVLIATRAPVLVCPAMHTEMWEHPSVQDNLALLRSRGTHVVEPETGRLAGGDVGAGRLAEPATIVAAAEAVLAGTVPGATAPAAPSTTGPMSGVKVLVTAGGTREPIDPVRFIGNRSSGKQGHAIAEEAAERGADVTLVTTTDLPVPDGIERVRVDTAAELHRAVVAVAPACDVVVMAAAVADFTPTAVAPDKLKKRDGVPVVELTPTVDVLAALGEVKPPGQVLVGFAAETADVVANATEKLQRKNADLLVANDVSAPGVGFEHDTNEVLIIGHKGDQHHVPFAHKRDVARAVMDRVTAVLQPAGRPDEEMT